MKIILAGYNVDSTVIEALKKEAVPRADVTPETLSAAYARISRDPRPVDELRAAARAEVERARRSNQSIIFKMGHHSVAEHAVFNFDVIGVSRLAIEEIERFRLCSFTEKSQRYITLGGDFVLPEEVREAGLESLFRRTVRAQNTLYGRLYRKLRPHVFRKHKDAARDPRNHPILDGWAKEDARYALSLAVCGQLGMTLNARNLELMIRRLGSSKLAELRAFRKRLFGLAREVAPSLMLFTESGAFDSGTLPAVREAFAARPGKGRKAPRPETVRDVALVEATPEADLKILAALGCAAGEGSFGECLRRARAMTPAERKTVARAAFERMEFYDFPLREFEHADLTFELVVSASCFAQLKRHRMATLTVQPYAPDLGLTIPASVEEIGARSEFLEGVARTNAAYETLRRSVGGAAAYILTNAHRRRVLFKTNARELYHISRLREDATAQWDIRAITGRMSALAKKSMPLTCWLLGGKDAYPEIYRRVFGRSPAILPPVFLK